MHFLSFHTIFILNENIKWLDEFIEYYSKIGFDHFYLYDNEGSDGNNGKVYESDDISKFVNENRYGFSRKIINQPEDIKKLEEILNKYSDCITYVKWQPRNDQGVIVYGQDDSVRDFVKKYGHETQWVAHMDFDEYLFSPSNLNIREYLQNIEPNISCIRLCQKKFKDRNLSTKAKMLEEFECVDLYVGDWWGAKNIFRPTDFLDISTPHVVHVNKNTQVADPSILRFNHHNVNEKQLAWMSWSMGRPFSLDSIDDGMKRYI